MTSVLVDEQQLIEARVKLARQMESGSVVLSARLAEAFLNTPRHPFVPVFYRRDGERFTPWRGTDGDGESWLAHVYSDDSLITEVDGVHAQDAGAEGVIGAPTSSSTAPSLMADMLDALDVRHGAEVLEIGTGTGYNTALLCRLAGEKNVTTVDNSAALTVAARTRLKALGFTPTVMQVDGIEGFPNRAPFDRIIATCSVRRIPPAWLDQCKPGGLMIVPIKGALAGGMLARLKKLPDGTAAGRILHTPAAFMPLLSEPQEFVKVPASLDGARRESELSGSVLDDWTFSFFAQLHMSANMIRAYQRKDGMHVTELFDPTDSSYTRVADSPEGWPSVTTAGPRDLWAPIESAYDQWETLNRPRREWFTIEATTAQQVLTYTEPDGRVHRWQL
ncbi:methyltransferase domain-containing protein [Streptomyces gobiensis]|uniref:methyltransferase domain-containing protein n=1 Tax=Streptomyces gobiensis TaxID=2875706 RepID=UPI001E2D22AD|nr:methyltransferase domain-containing protein [Streptomyces gobiensis]UGY91042.1 methyltransferase domain-containing protein [Streptomyces gobiensis]